MVFRPSTASRRWIPVVVGLLLAALATSAATQPHRNLLDYLLKLAQLAATLIGLYALVVAGPRELARWRRTKYDERCAEAASAALIATEDFLRALDAISSPARFEGDAIKEEGEKYSSFIRKWFRQRLESIEPQRTAFQRARVQAQVYLDEAECTPLVNVAEHYSAIFGALVDWTTFTGSGVKSLEEQALAAFRRLFIELPKERAALLDAAKTVLRPIAHYRVAPAPAAVGDRRS